MMSTPTPSPATTSTIEPIPQVLWRLTVLALLVLATLLSSCGGASQPEDDAVHDAAILEAHLDRTVPEAAGTNDGPESAQDLGTMVAGGVIAVEGAVDHELDASDFFSVAFSTPLRVTVALSFDATAERDLDLRLYVNGEPVGTLDASDSYEEREVELQTGDLLTMEAIAKAGAGGYEVTVVDWGMESRQESIGKGPAIRDRAATMVEAGR